MLIYNTPYRGVAAEFIRLQPLVPHVVAQQNESIPPLSALPASRDRRCKKRGCRLETDFPNGKQQRNSAFPVTRPGKGGKSKLQQNFFRWHASIATMICMCKTLIDVWNHVRIMQVATCKRARVMQALQKSISIRLHIAQTTDLRQNRRVARMTQMVRNVQVLRIVRVVRAIPVFRADGPFKRIQAPPSEAYLLCEHGRHRRRCE